MKYLLGFILCAFTTSAYAAATPEHKAALAAIDADYAQVSKMCLEARMPKDRADKCIKDAKDTRSKARKDEAAAESARKHPATKDTAAQKQATKDAAAVILPVPGEKPAK